MSRTFKSLVIALSGAGFLASAVGDVQACHPRGGGGFRSAGARVVVVQARPQQYPQQAYQPMGIPQQQLQYGQPGVVQGQNGQVGVQFQGTPTGSATTSAISALGGNVSGVGVGGTSAVQGQAAVGGATQAGYFPQGQTGGQFAGASSQFAGASSGATAQSQIQTQQAQTQVQPQLQAQGQSQTSIFGQSPTSQTQTSQTQQTQFQQTQTQQVQSQPTQSQQVQSQPLQTQQAQVQQTQAQQPTQQSQNAQTLALEALSGLDSSDAVSTATQASSQSTQPAITGNYSASLQSLGATVRLTLNADSSFAWVVTTKDGKSSTFQGSFAVSGNKLTLARTDNQKLEASLTPTATGFSLKMVGQNASALSFVRV